MSSDVWTPPVIATIVHQVVMIIVSIAFIWKKYRRPRRQTDEEQLVHVLIPTYNVPARRTRSAHKFMPRRSANAAPCPTPAPVVRQVLLDHMGDIVQTALGVDEDVEIIDGPSLSSNGFQNESTISVAIGPSPEADIGLDIELGDRGLRHRSADISSHTKKKTPRDSIAKDEA